MHTAYQKRYFPSIYLVEKGLRESRSFFERVQPEIPASHAPIEADVASVPVEFSLRTGGVAGFLASSGIGQEINFPKGAELELVLERPLYLFQQRRENIQTLMTRDIRRLRFLN